MPLKCHCTVFWQEILSNAVSYQYITCMYGKVVSVFSRTLSYMQGSLHIVKTGRLDFSLSWLKGEMWENLGDFRKSIQILTFLSSLPHVPLPFTKTNVLLYDLKKDAINEFGIKYWTSNPVWVKFQEHGNSFMWILKKKYDYWWKKYGLEKTDRATKTSLFDRNWVISLKPRRRSRLLCLVWWALTCIMSASCSKQEVFSCYYDFLCQ